jgi:hypothetical protein
MKILGMCSRVIRQKPVLTIDAHEKHRKKARKLLLRLKKEDYCKVCIILDEKLFIANALINHHNIRYLRDLPVSEVYENI